MNLGKAIKFYRIQQELNQVEFADLAEISVSYLSLLERGKRDPTLSTVRRIAAALEISMVVLFFVASDENEVASLGTEVSEKLAYAALRKQGRVRCKLDLISENL